MRSEAYPKVRCSDESEGNAADGRFSAAPSPQIHCTAGAGQHAGRWDLVTAARTVEPVAAMLALGVGQSLLAFTLRALPVHLAAGHIILEEQAATGAKLGIATVVGCLAARIWADEHRLAPFAPVLPLGHLLADRTLLHDGTSVTNEKAGPRGPALAVLQQGGGQSTLKNAAGRA